VQPQQCGIAIAIGGDDRAAVVQFRRLADFLADRQEDQRRDARPSSARDMPGAAIAWASSSGGSSPEAHEFFVDTKWYPGHLSDGAAVAAVTLIKAFSRLCS
jgi:hypothetical protein